MNIWTQKHDFSADERENVEQGVAPNARPAASSNRHGHSTFKSQSKPRPGSGVGGLGR